MDKTISEKLEDLLLAATPEELPGLLEHARLVVKIRGMVPAKRKYERKQAPHTDSCICDGCQTARAQL